MKRTRLRRPLIASTLLIASLGAASPSEAASAKRCKALAGKAKVVVKTSKAMVIVRGTRGNFTQTFSACLYTKPGLYKIPGQNGGDTERFSKFTLAGRFLAYEHVNVEEASDVYPGYIGLVDIKRRKRIYERDAIPLTKDEEQFGAVSGVTQILLRSDGAVAWIGREENSKRAAVQTVLPSQKKETQVDAGKDIGTHSLRQVASEPDAFSWVQGGMRKAAPFGGPALTP